MGTLRYKLGTDTLTFLSCHLQNKNRFAIKTAESTFLHNLYSAKYIANLQGRLAIFGRLNPYFNDLLTILSVI